MFWKGTVLESVVYILQNSSLYRVFTNVHSQAAFWSFLLTSCSSEGPIIEKSIRRIVSSTAHPKAALSPWKMLSMFLKGSCRGLQKVKSEVMKHSPGHSRSLSVQQWHFVTRKKNHPTPHSCTSLQYNIHICIAYNASTHMKLIRTAHKSVYLTQNQREPTQQNPVSPVVFTNTHFMQS